MQNEEVLEKIAAGWRSQLNLDNCYFIMSNIQGLPTSWGMVDCTFTTAEDAEKAFQKRVSNTATGVLGLVDPSNKVLRLVQL